MDYQRLEKIAKFLRNIPASSWDCRDGEYGFSEEDVHFKFYLKPEKGDIVNAAEGGIIVGRGDNAEVINHLPVRKNTQRVILEISDLITQCSIESYNELGDLPDESYVQADGTKTKLPALFSLYKDIRDSISAYGERNSRASYARNVDSGKEKLDRLLGIE